MSSLPALTTVFIVEAVSIGVIEVAMNVVDYCLGGMRVKTLFVARYREALAVGSVAGFLVAWPVTVWLLARHMKSTTERPPLGDRYRRMWNSCSNIRRTRAELRHDGNPVNHVFTNGHAYYSVTPDVEVVWRELLVKIGSEADIAFEFVSYPLPQPLEELWSRTDRRCVFMMCGYPIAMGHFEVMPIAAPIPSAVWARGRALYRSNLIVKADGRFQTLADTFGGRLGWAVSDSHSGFNALRHHLLQYRTPERRTLYSQVVGNLGSVRKVFDAVCDGAIDVGAVDAYWHMLLQHYEPELATRVRVIGSTATAPIPAFVASPAVSREIIDRLAISFASARDRTWFRPLADATMIDGFASRVRDDFRVIRTRHQEAIRAGYPLPA